MDNPTLWLCPSPLCAEIMRRSKLGVRDGARNMNFKFMNATQLQERSEAWKQNARSAQLELFNAKKAKSRLMSNLDYEKRRTLLISRENIPGVRRVLANALKRRMSGPAILDKLRDALDGIYHARGWTEEENDLALLVLRLGGPSLLNVLHTNAGLPGLTYTRKLASKVIDSSSNDVLCSFNSSPHFFTGAPAIPLQGIYRVLVSYTLPCMFRPHQMTFTGCAAGSTENVKRALIANIKMLRLEVKNLPPTMWKVGIDDVAIDQKAQWNASTNTVTRRATAYVVGLAPNKPLFRSTDLVVLSHNFPFIGLDLLRLLCVTGHALE